jgi:hypothetical protein
MNMFFEFMSMILNNHMFKIDFSKMRVLILILIFYFVNCPKKRGLGGRASNR